MRYNLKNNKGNILVLVCIALPALIGVIGLCLDGSLMIYYQSKLMAATKFAAVSAASNYEIVDDKIIITATESEVTTVLSENFSQAKLTSFNVSSISKNKCTVIAETQVNFVFMKMFGINNKTLSESYSVTRK